MWSISRIVDVSITMVPGLLIEAGKACAEHHDVTVRGVCPKRIQRVGWGANLPPTNTAEADKVNLGHPQPLQTHRYHHPRAPNPPDNPRPVGAPEQRIAPPTGTRTATVFHIRMKPTNAPADDPFATFTEWKSADDAKAYAKL